MQNLEDNGQTKRITTVSDDKPKRNKVKIIVGAIVVVTIIVVCTTIFIVSKNKKEQGDTDTDQDELELVASVKDTYEGLNYSTNKESLEQIGNFYDYSRGLEGFKIDVSYQKVDGLKDKNKENYINEELKNTAYSLYDNSLIQDNNTLYEHIYNYTDVYIFNNVVSTMYCKEVCDIDGVSKYEYKAVNLNIKDKKEFTINDIYISSFDINSILNDIEKDELNNNMLVFSVSPKNVYIAGKEKVRVISLYDNKESVAIFKRFADNKKLFNTTYTANPYVFTTKKFIETDSYGTVEENLFIDTFSNLDYDIYTKGLRDKTYTLYRDGINRARNVAYSNPSKRYLAQLEPTITKNEEDKTYTIAIIYDLYEIEKNFYANSIIDFVVASENKSRKENEKVNYFKNTVMDADDYLLNKSVEIIRLKVDENGEEIKEELVNMGIS